MTDLQYCDANQTSTTIKSDKSIKTVFLCECSGNESASYIHENKIPSFNKPFKSPIKLYWMNIHKDVGLVISDSEVRKWVKDSCVYHKIPHILLSLILQNENNPNAPGWRQAIGALKNRIQELDKATSRLNYQFIALYASAFVALVIILFLALFLFVPSMDEIKQRRADVAWLEQKYSLDIKNCDGKSCIRIIKNNCHGTNKDYCVIDPK